MKLKFATQFKTTKLLKEKGSLCIYFYSQTLMQIAEVCF